MKVSLITACFNNQDTIEDALSSVIYQTYTNIEHIIIDGQSTDDTLSIVNKYKGNISRVVSENDNGIYDALNKGIKYATGDIVGFLHADDMLASNDVIEMIVNTFKNNPSIDAVYGDLQYVDRKNSGKVIRNWKSKPFQINLFYKGWMPAHPTFYCKKECYLKYGVFNDKDFKTAADYELMLRFILKNKINPYYLPKLIVKMRVGGVSNKSLKNRFKANLEDRKAWEINGLKPKFYTLYLKPLSKLIQYI
ncbi:MAG: glycosyltransferase family 2 protein [Vicingaceae bacterium]